MLLVLEPTNPKSLAFKSFLISIFLESLSEDEQLTTRGIIGLIVAIAVADSKNLDLFDKLCLKKLFGIKAPKFYLYV